MIKQFVLTTAQMVTVDRSTIVEIGIPGVVLMENAGRRIAEIAADILGGVHEKNIVILCGKGNNGGDGYVVARYLFERAANVHVVLTSQPEQIKGDAVLNLTIIRRLGIRAEAYNAEKLDNLLSSADLVVDALLGTGVTGELKGVFREIVEKANQRRTVKLAVDLPTGMNADTGAVTNVCFQANHTVTMGFLKRGLLFSPGRERAGRTHVAEIGFPASVLAKLNVSCSRTTPEDVAARLPRRNPNAYKNQCGEVLTIAGSTGMTGAAALTAESALRVGAGLSILAIPKSLNHILEQKLTEVMTLPVDEEKPGGWCAAAKAQLAEKLTWAKSIAVGPGMGADEGAFALVKWLLQGFVGPFVIDADGLNCLQGNTELIKNSKADLIITPHPGELSRLLSISKVEILANPVETAIHAAKSLKVIVVLKGGPTVIANPQGETFINSTGNAGMATAGMGDVLTGIIAGLLAQGAQPFDAAIVGVYLHGAAGDSVKETAGEAGLLAGDVLSAIPSALQQFEIQKETEIEYI